MTGRGDDPAGGSPRRRLDLPGGRTLTIRDADPTDVDGLDELFRGLDPEDRHRRFFSAYGSSPTFLDRLVRLGDTGGVELVAVVAEADGTARVVGEAGYALLPNGDGELGITVAAAWRGWLGPFLLDAVVEIAASRGVPNIEADVLVANEPMLAMARARGAVTIAHPDWGVVRVLVGTGGSAPSWPAGHDRPRVLVEGPGRYWHAPEAEAAGLDVVVCPGPVDRRRRCPALAGQPCPLAAGADVVVVAHPPDHPDWRALTEAHHTWHPGVPVCVELPAEAPVDGDVAGVDAGAGAAHVVAFVQRLADPGAGESGSTG